MKFLLQANDILLYDGRLANLKISVSIQISEASRGVDDVIFKTKKTIITNPDEMILQIASKHQDRYGRELAAADPETLATALGHFDIKTTCKVLMILPSAHAAKVLVFFSQPKKDAIIERLPSHFAAELMETVLKI